MKQLSDNWASIQQICNTALTDFKVCLTAPQQCQTDILQSILHNNRNSVFGQQHQFVKIKDYQSFTKQVMIAEYDDFHTDILSVAEGKNNLLTTSPVIQFEETSGSSSGAKLIPYTDEVLAAFQRAILPWLGDLLQHRPNIMCGRLFFMISPALRPATVTKGGIPIGAGNDLGYFGNELAIHLAQVTLWSPILSQPQPPHQWKENIALLLLQASDLTLISLWSPTLLLEIVDYIIQHKQRLLDKITDSEQHALLDTAIGSDSLNTQAIWGQLDTISCWDSHTSASHAQKIQQLFPHTVVQGKGILSTEAVTSLPFSPATSPILAINSHFYEFIDEENQVFLAHELSIGKSYRVIVTTQSGLYRYDTGDMVTVSGYYQQTPTLKFIGRTGLSSDLCGEKLTETFVAQAIEKTNNTLLGQSLLQAVNTDRPYYRWVIASPIGNAQQVSLIQQLEKHLCQNPQYHYARKIGQLSELQIQIVTDINHYYQQQTQHKKQRLGTMKLPALLPAF
ncbi:MAG: GH3 auxin-responsive promoter family protein [Gammaproteobacteria bacterium]|nr:GH3 auxin-responsive promoter family protein [Gammaproteobacteria bacterium]